MADDPFTAGELEAAIAAAEAAWPQIAGWPETAWMEDALRAVLPDHDARITAALAELDALLAGHTDHCTQIRPCTQARPCGTRQALTSIRTTLTGEDHHHDH